MNECIQRCQVRGSVDERRRGRLNADNAMCLLLLQRLLCSVFAVCAQLCAPSLDPEP